MEHDFNYPNLFETSESTVNIAKAMVEFSKAIGVISKDAKNPFFRSDYAPLPTILKDIKDPMQKAGLSLNHFPVGDNCLVSRLSHTSGEYYQSMYFMKAVKDTPQDRGSVITYQMRYAVGALLGLAIDKDDDGNKGTHATNNQTVSKQKPVLKTMTKTIKEAMMTYVDKDEFAVVEKQLPKYNKNKMTGEILKAIAEKKAVNEINEASK